MIEKFLSLNPEKQERILNAALKEFAQKGFENASTNEMVKEAGISKGLLFHYFKNKKELYLFLYDHFVEILMKEFYEELNLEETDIFARLKNLMLLKSRLIIRHPEIFNFMVKAKLETSDEVREHLTQSSKDMLQSSYATIFQNIDYSKFKEGTDIQKAINIIFWTLEGLSNKTIEQLKLSNETNFDFTEAFAEVDVYIEMLKSTFYK